MNFENAWDRTMLWEGGGRLHRTEGDPGGWTKFGISQRAHPDVDVVGLDAARARRITKAEYWDAVDADDLPSQLRWHVFDMAFNAGQRRAIRILQLSINLCQQAQGWGQSLVVDGALGPRTKRALDLVPHDRIARVYKAYRVEHYIMLAETGQAKFIHGWLRRAEGGVE